MTEPASKKPLVVLDMDGVILTRNEAYIDYYRELFTKYVKPHLPESWGVNDEQIKKCVTERLERLKGNIAISENFSPYGLLYILSDLLPQGYTAKKLKEESAIENNTLSKLREKINPENHANFPQLNPTKDMASVMSLTTYCDVVLLTVSTKENIDKYFTGKEQACFEKIIIVPTSVNSLVEEATGEKISLFKHYYPEDCVFCYLADQKYEKDVAEGIGAQMFIQITGDVPTDQHLPESVRKFSTLREAVDILPTLLSQSRQEKSY
ncbi:MAG: hypothetical protein ACK5O9_01600 [Holosporales bacterium]|jgi:hypothetical protein